MPASPAASRAYQLFSSLIDAGMDHYDAMDRVLFESNIWRGFTPDATVKKIMELCADHYGVSLTSMIGKERSPKYANARHAFRFAIHQLGYSKNKIAIATNTCHSVVLNSIVRAETSPEIYGACMVILDKYRQSKRQKNELRGFYCE